MAEAKKFSIICPSSYSNKISVIKSIRVLTGIGLKDAKDASERKGPQTFEVDEDNFSSYGNPDIEIEKEFQILRAEGIIVGAPVQKLLEGLRELGSQALLQGEDELANEILQLVLAEKLRRKP